MCYLVRRYNGRQWAIVTTCGTKDRAIEYAQINLAGLEWDIKEMSYADAIKAGA